MLMSRIIPFILLWGISCAAQSAVLEFTNTSGFQDMSWSSDRNSADGDVFAWKKVSNVNFFANSGFAQEQKPFGYAITKVQSDRYDRFFNLLPSSSFGGTGGTDQSDFMLGGSFGTAAPIPEPQTYAMVLAGIGLLMLSARGRRDDNFD